MANLTVAHKVAAFPENAPADVWKARGIGPVMVVVNNESDADLGLGAYRINRSGVAGRADASVTSTAVADEDTGYDGDTSTTDFTGQALNNTPIIPRSVTIKPTAGGDTVNLIDGGDGKFYTDDNDADEAGTIDYFTGDIVLAFPAGKAPNTGDIDADYSHEDTTVAARGRKTYIFNSLHPEEQLVIVGHADAASAKAQVEVAVGDDATFDGGVNV